MASTAPIDRVQRSIRLLPQTDKVLVRYAKANDLSINAAVEAAIYGYCANGSKPTSKAKPAKATKAAKAPARSGDRRREQVSPRFKGGGK